MNDISNHWPFAEQSDRLVCLSSIEDIVEILGSQTRPKKMTWIGSDGHRYIIVAKPNVNFDLLILIEIGFCFLLFF